MLPSAGLRPAMEADILGENGSFLRVAIHKETRVATKVKEDNWTAEAHARYAELFPEGKDVKKAKIAPKKKKITKKPAKIVDEKKPTAEEKLAAEQQALIAAMVSDAAAEKLEEKTQAPVQVTDAIAQAEEENSASINAKNAADEDEELEEEELEELDEEEEEGPRVPRRGEY